MNLKSYYLAVELTEASRAALMSNDPPVHERIIAHHVTIAFNPTEQDLVLFPEGSQVRIEVYAHGFDDKAHAVRVMLNKSATRPDGKHYHVTISVSKIGKPVDSNQIESFTPRAAYELTGVVKLIQK